LLEPRFGCTIRLVTVRKEILLVLAGATLVLASSAALECHSVVTASVPQAPLLPSALYGLVLWGWWGVAASILWIVAENGTTDFFSLRAAIWQFFIGPALAAAHIWVLQSTIEWIVGRWPVIGPAGYGSLNYLSWNRFFFELLVYAFAFALVGMVRLKLVSQREELRALELEKQLAAAHLRALQMQLEPHFLFNTLNAIASLVELDRKREAIETLERLNAILHRTLRDGTPPRIRVAQELALLDDYLSIEQTRFADRLRVDLAIDPEALAGMIPCFLMQPLVENAIRHGISRSEEGGSIHVKVERKGERLRLQVRDSGAGGNGQAADGHGIGLRNTRERLSRMYGEQFDLRAEPLAAGGFEVAVELPYERETV
jgi:two-component sensor histidine kinase